MKQLVERCVNGFFFIFLFYVNTGELAGGEEKKRADNPAKLAKEAFLSATTNLRTGSGTGTYEVFTKDKDKQTISLVVKAKVIIHFSNKKYHVKMTYEKGKSGNMTLVSRIIIFDGKTIATSRFSPPPGNSKRAAAQKMLAAGELFEPEAVPGAGPAGFAFDPSKLPMSILDVASIYNEPSVTVEYTSRPGGGHTGKYIINGVICEFDILPEAGFNVTAFRVWNEGKPGIVQDYRAEWERSEGIWFVKKIVQQFNWLSGAKTRLVLSYDTFQVNPDVSPDLFHINALQLPPRTRILDQRPQAKMQEYYTQPEPIPESDKLDSLLEEAKSLPHSTPVEPPGNPILRWVAIGGGLLLSIVGLILYLIRRRSRRSPVS